MPARKPLRWHEQAEWEARFDAKPPGDRGKRAKVWHFESVGDRRAEPYRWTIKDSFSLFGCGNASSLAAAKRAAIAAASKLGWLK